MSSTLTTVEELPLELHNGDSMTRGEFHRIYSTMPEHIKAELIEGIVYMASPLKYPHGRHHIILGTLFGTYEAHTPGVEAADNASIFLGDDSEPQPDLVLRVTAEFGGQSHINQEGYVVDAPELFAEIADSSHSLDLHGKRRDYQKYGGNEYLVVNIHGHEIRWFDLSSSTEHPEPSDGIFRLKSMPGLWINAHAVLEENVAEAMATLNLGLASPEHNEIVRRLAKISS